MGEVVLGCSGWNYPDTADKGGWTGIFYPDKDIKRLRYYSQFKTAEMTDSRHHSWRIEGPWKMLRH
jgi:uncharacterized protein YecE (DUF72 family)